MSYPLEHQEMTFWCWAAVAASVRAFFDSTRSLAQCTVATDTLNRFDRRPGDPPYDCCQNASSGNKPFYLDLALTTIGHFNVIHFQPLSFNDVEWFVKELRLPICAYMESGASAHYVVICDCQRAPSGANYVYVCDPHSFAPVPQKTLYEAFLWSYYDGSYQWEACFFVQP
ncbi:MAG: hypothetical protein IPJ98_29920 [Bryobacterales bacterium]|nr:hypothetical protein [Bryobacterales bacterium]